MNKGEAKRVLSNIYLLQMQGNQMECPCCGDEMRADINENSLSRYHEVYICPDCGTREALSGAVPLDEWEAIKRFERASIAIEKVCSAIENGKTAEDEVEPDKIGPGIVIVKDKNDAMVGVLLVKNADKYLSDCVEDIEANWILMRESYLERAQEDKSFLFDEDDEHLAYVEAQLKLCVSDDAEHTPYEVENLENVCVVEAN